MNTNQTSSARLSTRRAANYCSSRIGVCHLSIRIAKPYLMCDHTGRVNRSDNPKAPVFRLFAKTPLGNDVEIGTVWQKKNRDGDRYYSVLINTGHSRINANLGRMAGQDDLYAIIPWE